MLNFVLSLFFLSLNFAGVIDQVTLAVKDLDIAAGTFSKKGFTLKVPHEYKKGHQKGLIVQSIRFKDGSYLQLVAVKTPQGELSKWYQKFIKNQEGGATLVLRQPNLKGLKEKFLKAELKAELKTFKDHNWLSFKTDNPLQNLSFIEYKKSISQVPDLLNHINKSFGIHSLRINPIGPAKNWAKALTLSQSQLANLLFSAITFNNGSFVREIILKTKLQPVPEAFQIGETRISFVFK
ncbi:MAG: hypothetical protein NXH75_08830 [Halobacteriovoraceae bacterium]|nr:hypothetical protein [Halobacteriovoraceae bacterium]